MVNDVTDAPQVQDAEHPRTMPSRGAKAATAAELEDTPYLIKAEPTAWKSVLGGKTDPIVGLMGGKLKLTKGSLFAYFWSTIQAI